MNPPRRRRTSPAMLVAALLAVLITTIWESRSRETPPAAPERVEQPARVPAEGPAPAAAPAPEASRPSTGVGVQLDAAVESAEEREALESTLALIDQDGPFPYPGKDGSMFANRERRLPKQPRGYYREYTVPTRGESDRGARRVVTGRGGERWYTRDHYRTFTRIDALAPVR